MPILARVIGSIEDLRGYLREDTSCDPTVLPQSLLFAYSNDLSPQTVSDTLYALATIRNDWCVGSTWFGSVRFDFTGNIDIVFNSGFEDINSTIYDNLPDPSQGFQNSSIGSNVFDVIEFKPLLSLTLLQNFFSNTEAPVCGSVIVILLKRYPNEADISRLVSLIRYHHAVLHVITSTTPSGRSQQNTMYSMASKTNGMGAFEYDENFRVAGGTYIALLEDFHQVNYSMSLDYNYSGQDVQNLQIRIYAEE
ncbi:hypothetical protein B9Z55_027547 [Caenorhabditis nigoni]|uniref:DUF7154 domain-containing protein n=1 Tax=Caenorhabditis nigoni TaxID=1611254 RepID=A0A2G5SF35_9PELO|nr:hypothetical protein B9Z55_027547 [Caenorhabditis nigoni]